MLNLHENARITRRQLLQIGGLTLGGLSLSSLLQAKAAAPSGSLVSGKSVIFLFLQGGPPQFETFDPKPEAPSDIATITGVTRTALPGVLFGDTLQQLAPLADKLSIIRSYSTGNAAHNIKPIVGPESLNANIGCLVSRILGPTHPVTSMPTNAVLFPQSVCSDVARGSGRGDLAATGSIGPNYAPFVPGGNGQLLRNLRLNLPAARFSDRQELLSQFGALNRSLENEAQGESFDRNQRQACEVLLQRPSRGGARPVARGPAAGGAL